MSETMAAIIKTAPKPGCMEYVTDFPKPEIKEDEILVQVKACGICGTDHSLYGMRQLPRTTKSSSRQSLVMSFQG